jgi:hypothetical protein
MNVVKKIAEDRHLIITHQHEMFDNENLYECRYILLEIVVGGVGRDDDSQAR